VPVFELNHAAANTRAFTPALTLYGFEKSERSNIKANELSTLKSVAKVWLSMPAAGLKAALRAGEIKEVKQDE